jgi:hypothetical protein
MSKFRTATPKEIADCIQRQVVDTCELAELPEYRSKPSKLRALIRDIRLCSKSNADWLRSQQSEEKDANLIAAAPDLLAALGQMVRYNDADPDLYSGDNDGVLGRIMFNCRTAIAKAEGGEV